MPDFSAKSWDASGCAALVLEASINWEDDPRALALTLADVNGRFGAARVDRALFESLVKLRRGAGVALERKLDPDVPTNIYHGNMLFGVGMARGMIKAFANALTLDADYIPPP